MRGLILSGFAVLSGIACGSRSELLVFGDTAAKGGTATDARAASSTGGSTGGSSSSATAEGGPGTGTGCADGAREGFIDASRYPSIAGCSGAWTVPGVHAANPGFSPACGTATYDTVTPACGRRAGDDSRGDASGNGCNVADLCAVGWHVCTGAADVASRSPSGCNGSTAPGDPAMFFATRQSGPGCGVCATGTTPNCDSTACTIGCKQTAATSNDFFGCGNFGATAPISGCSPLDRFSNDNCAGLASDSWACSGSYCEAYTVTKQTTAFGGVLCCAD